jgi:glycosyltransferase involved in cell wall biosynthesis
MLLIFIIIATVFLIMRLTVATYNYFSAPMLEKGQEIHNALISVLIPIRNEEDNIANLLDSLLLQQGVNMEILVLNDHSTDKSAEIVSAYSNKHPCIKLISGAPLPAEWTGKNYACHQLAIAARGKYLAFIDADVDLKPNLLSSALSRLATNELSLLSLFATQKMVSFGEQITVPLMNYLLLTLLPLRLIEKHQDPIFSAACGQFMLFDATHYSRHLWHSQARGIIAEDLAIMKMVKQSGGRGEGLMAGELMCCRMYSGYHAAIYGFSKNFISPFNNSIPLFLLFITTLIVPPVAMLLVGNIYFMILYLALLIILRYFTARLTGVNPLREIFLHPMQMISLILISIIAVYWKSTNVVKWKGRSFNLLTARNSLEI